MQFVLYNEATGDWSMCYSEWQDPYHGHPFFEYFCSEI